MIRQSLHRICRPLLPVMVCAMLVGCSKPAQYYTAGASAAPVNPPVGSFIAGDRQDRHFTGIHDSLFVKAVVVSDGKEKIAIVTVDCIGLLKPEMDRIRQRVAGETEFSPDHIVISSTHSHSGPDVVGIWGKDYTATGIDTAYLDFLVSTAAQQVVRADRARVPVAVRSVSGTFDAPWVENISDVELDRTVSVLQLLDAQQRSVATLTNFACHPTFMDGSFSVVSADYPGYFYKAMDKSLGGVNLFLQGAIGGWVQPENGKPGFEGAAEAGNGLAAVALNLIGSARENTSSNGIMFRSEPVLLPVDNPGWKMLSQAGVIRRTFSDSVTTDLTVFSIGEAHFATHPGETSPWLGLQTRAMMPEGTRFVMGLSQDALGYILKPEFFTDTTFRHSGYLTSMSLGPATTPIIKAKLEEMYGKFTPGK
ncbi:MAG: neutral/alkaline non-lysosomal ceramidase N-terminal domain-containing protein [Bacteroidota bacterium]